MEDFEPEKGRTYKTVKIEIDVFSVKQMTIDYLINTLTELKEKYSDEYDGIDLKMSYADTSAKHLHLMCGLK